MTKNADSSENDLADLSKIGPRQKYRFWSRAGMNFRVRLIFGQIVSFSENALSFGPNFGRNGSFDKTRK